MVRATVIPTNQDIFIHVPENYVGRTVEVLLYAIDELSEPHPQVKSIASLRGCMHLSEEEQSDLQQYLKEVRNEWD